jgi:hypothetical protein
MSVFPVSFPPSHKQLYFGAESSERLGNKVLTATELCTALPTFMPHIRLLPGPNFTQTRASLPLWHELLYIHRQHTIYTLQRRGLHVSSAHHHPMILVIFQKKKKNTHTHTHTRALGANCWVANCWVTSTVKIKQITVKRIQRLKRLT